MADFADDSIDVVIPAWNSEKTIEISINSVLQQTIRVKAIIVVDDASTDATADRVRTLMRTNSQILLLSHNENQGCGPARNTGIAASRAQFVALHDADDVATPRRLESQVHTLRSDVRLALVAGGWSRLGPGQKTSRKRQRVKRLPLDHRSIMHALQTLRPALHSPTVTFRRSSLGSLDQLFRPQVRTSEDRDLFFRMEEAGLRFAQVPEVVSLYRRHEGQTSIHDAERQLWDTHCTLAARRQRLRGLSDPIEEWTGFPDVQWFLEKADADLIASLWLRLQVRRVELPDAKRYSVTDEFISATPIESMDVESLINALTRRPLLKWVRLTGGSQRWVGLKQLARRYLPIGHARQSKPED